MPAHVARRPAAATPRSARAARRQPWWRDRAAWRAAAGAGGRGSTCSSALLDSIAWVGGARGAAHADLVAAHTPRSVIDRLFPLDFRERSYSAPLAAVEFYGDARAALPRPPSARHRHPRPRRAAADAQGRARRAAHRRLLEPASSSRWRCRRHERRLLRPARRRRGVLRHQHAVLDPHPAAAHRPGHGARPRHAAGLRRARHHQLGRLRARRARRDAQAARARLRRRGARARRQPTGAS